MKNLKTILGVVLLVALFVWAAPSLAVLLVSYTLQPVTASDCIGISVTKQTDGEGGSVLVTTFTFAVRDENGIIRETGATTMQLTPAQQATLATFVTNNGVPAFNTQRGL